MIDITPLIGFLNTTIARLVVAIVILLIGILFARFLSKLTYKVLHEIRLNILLNDELGLKLPLEEFFSRLIMYIVYFITLITALNQLGLTATVLYIILIVILLIIIVLMILAFKDFVPNITAGFYIYNKRNIKIGDIISTNNVDGKVIEINLIETRVKTSEGDEVLIPNSLILKSELKIKK